MTPDAWQPIATAPRTAGHPILAWCNHEADPYSDLNDTTGRGRLTLYAAHAEGLSHAPTGFHIVEWGGGISFAEDEGGGYLPDWWFVVGSEFEIAANPTHWTPLPSPPDDNKVSP